MQLSAQVQSHHIKIELQPIILFQTGDYDWCYGYVQNRDDNFVGIVLWLCFLSFLLGCVVGWFLHKKKVKKFKFRKRVYKKSDERRDSSSE